MKRTLITLIAAGTLAVPAGLALAQDDSPEPTEPTPTCEEHEHSRDRINQQDPAAEHGQHRAENRYQVGEAPCDGDCPGPMAQERNQVRVEDGNGDQVRNQVRVEDGTGEQERNQFGLDDEAGYRVRNQVRVDDEAGDGICDGDCTGEQELNRNEVRLTDETGDRVQLRTPTRIADAGNGRSPGNG
jgi:Ni/Co efflux regulator RcnB